LRGEEDTVVVTRTGAAKGARAHAKSCESRPRVELPHPAPAPLRAPPAPLPPPRTPTHPSNMAKTPSKKAAKVAKAAAGDKKKSKKRSRKESYGTYIYKVLKQVHPGEWAGGGAGVGRRGRAASFGGWVGGAGRG